MKKILSIIIALALIASGFIYFTKENEDSTRVIRTLPVTKAAETEIDTIPVKVMSVQKNQTSYLNVSGSVKSEEQIKVFASAIGQITSVKVVEGQEVKKGQILFQIGGLNNTKHSLYNQLEMATNNLNVAKEGYNKTIAGNAVALNAANLQLKSAINQLNGTKTDLETIDNNLNYGQENLDLLEDAYDLTVEKNENSLNQIDDLINNLVTAQDELITKKQQLQQQLNSINTGTLDQATKDKMTTELKAGIAALEKSIKELDTQLKLLETPAIQRNQ
jgi:multidrug efflux pump subunit AcrA (membrane-fusion protein)